MKTIKKFLEIYIFFLKQKFKRKQKIEILIKFLGYDANEIIEIVNREIYDEIYDNKREIKFNPQNLLIMKKKI